MQKTHETEITKPIAVIIKIQQENKITLRRIKNAMKTAKE